MAQRLRKQFIDLLEKDVEFRYTVAGYLGLSEVLKRLDAVEAELRGLREDVKKLWEEVKSLREGENKLWEEVKSLREGQEKLWEGQNRLWEEVKSLRDGQNKLWESVEKLWVEVKNLREGQEKLWENQNRLWEGQNKLWEEVKSLREGQEKLWEEVKSLREGENKLWEEVKSLREGQNKLWEEVKNMRDSLNRLWESHFRLEKYVRTGFEGLRKALHITFEDYSRSFTQLLLEEMGYGWREVDRKILVSDGEPVEVDIFCEEPLVVGEATSLLERWDDVERELDRLEKRVELASRVYGRKPEMVLLCVGRVSEDIAPSLRRAASTKGVRLVLGGEIKEAVI